MLTLAELKEMKPDSVFATGTAFDTPEGLYMAGTGRELRWIAQRGMIHDWAIYCHFAEKTEEWIARHGDKVHAERHIRKLVPCDNDAFAMYRY